MVGSLDALEAVAGAIGSIALTDNAPDLSLTATQLVGDASVLLKITSDFGITLSGPATAAQVLAANATLLDKLTTGLAVSDSAANVAAQIAALEQNPTPSPRSR